MHTPGPWQVTPAESLMNQQVYWIHASKPERFNGVTIVEVPKDVKFYGKAVSEATILANARLIAAAPELLAALEAAMELGAYRGDRMPIKAVKPIFDTMKAAIAKAKGE